MKNIILGIETSCDETAVALYEPQHGLLGHELYSQAKHHAQFGGVVPELASRDHIRKITPLLQTLLTNTGCAKTDINAIAYTAGPGLIGALLVGSMYAHSLAWAWQIPCIAVHHMEAHLLAVMLEQQVPTYPFLALLVSGGHTLLVQVKQFADYQLLGETIDDAVGEAFDKTAKTLGLGYPGGPILEKIALNGNAERFHFPRPMTDRPGLDFSFSGLKTAVVNAWRTSDQSLQTKADIAAAFQHAVAETLLIKVRRALEQTQLNQLVIAGGAGANQFLRTTFNTHLADQQLYYPRSAFCTDNAAMVAYTGYLHWQQAHIVDNVIVKPRWPLNTHV